MSQESSGSVEALVGEAGGPHVVTGSVCQAPSPREKGQALGFLQHNLQLLKVLQPSHVLVLDRKENTLYLNQQQIPQKHFMQKRF